MSFREIFAKGAMKMMEESMAATQPSTELAALVRPIIGIENRTALEVFEIMIDRIVRAGDLVPAPIKMLLNCPKCGLQHIDAPDERTPDWENPPHRSHLCHGCGCIWRPCDVATEGVAAIETVGKADTWAGGDLVPRPVAVDAELRENVAKALYAASCALDPVEAHEPDWGRGGYKTQVLYWEGLARAAITATDAELRAEVERLREALQEKPNADQ